MSLSAFFFVLEDWNSRRMHELARVKKVLFLFQKDFDFYYQPRKYSLTTLSHIYVL
jgi:hypothetical protein